MSVKRARVSFAAVVDGVPRVVNEGQLVDAGDPVIKGRESSFEDVNAYVTRRGGAAVEDATAPPGGKRTRRRTAPTSTGTADE
jgi:hypothetical protein